MQSLGPAGRIVDEIAARAAVEVLACAEPGEDRAQTEADAVEEQELSRHVQPLKTWWS
jgi:hypothetical protein